MRTSGIFAALAALHGAAHREKNSFLIYLTSLNGSELSIRAFAMIIIVLCDFSGFYFRFEELENIDCALIVEPTFGIVELGKGG